MATIVRRNERSWAIEIISQMNLMLEKCRIRIKRAGGESTLSVNKQSMFPDVLLYADEQQTKILQGWELKMPDVLITDEALIKDAERKARALGLNSFVIWNFTYGKLYVKDLAGDFTEAKVWSGTDHIRSRQDVTTYREEWLPVIREILLTVNEYLTHGEIFALSLAETLSEDLVTEIIQRNKELVAETLRQEASRSMPMESRLKVWWKSFREEYAQDETNLFSAYAKSILLNWTNRVLFANLIRKYHECAGLVQRIDSDSTPEDGNRIMDEIIARGDFYNVFQRLEYNDRIPEDTWIDIVDYNQFLYSNKVESIDQSALQDILEKTVNGAKREIRGQYATPYCLARLLCQITVEDWHGHCGDFCAGTGTIAKAILENKMKRLKSPEETFETTWVGDKYAYPLQIANIALTSMEALNIPLQLFQRDAFEIEAGQTITIRSPLDGSKIQREIPRFHAIVSNLPFVKYNKIALDEADYMEACRRSIYENTGIEFTSGKTDLYNYLPFKLYELLEDEGRLGLVLSNSWLGTDMGLKFYQALQYYYQIRTIVLSNRGRWFENADVVTTLLVLKKKPISRPNGTECMDFCLLNKEIRELNPEEMEQIISSIVLREELDASLLSMKRYTAEEIRSFLGCGTTLNACFHDLSWLKEMRERLIPVNQLLTVKRGERRGWNDLFYPKADSGIEREYIRPVLKNPAKLQSYTARPDMEAFCCHRSPEELEEMGHMGALNWIRRFEQITNGTGKKLPLALKRPGYYWYEMDDGTKADFVTALNPDRRLFVAKFEESTFVDQRFTRLLQNKNSASMDLIHALLNSIYGMFAIEAIGFGRGLGVLDASSTKLKNMYMINPRIIGEEDEKEILELFAKIKARDVMDTDKELKDRDREAFDRKVLKAIGCGHLYEPIRSSLLSMQRTRHAVEGKRRR